MEGNTTEIIDPHTGQAKKFGFDYSYWSHDGFVEDPETKMFEKDTPSSKYASQTRVFNDLGLDVLDNAFNGYHTCLFAYGQTGSGKSYSIFGYGANIGIIPMACSEIFRRIKDAQDKAKRDGIPPPKFDEEEKGNKTKARSSTSFFAGDVEYEVTVSMLEIYNECVQDLFVKPTDRPRGGLSIRETKKGEVYVEGLKTIPVTSYEDIAEQIERGTSLRTIGATNMNATSSRAHTVTTISFKQTFYTGNKPTNQKNSNINLVDLAGSERARTTGADAERLKEGSNINKSLSFLGKVITILADKASGKKEAKSAVVPYRESKLTRILQNALGGNSKTSMIAALSPADINFEETLSTLVYANQVKSIKNRAKINENPQDKLIRELKEENERLKQMMQDKDAIQQEIEEEKKHEDDLEGKVYIMNINEDPLLTGQIKHSINDGNNLVGKPGKIPPPDIAISGIGVVPGHAQMKFDEASRKLMLHPNEVDAMKNKTYLNGDLISTPIELKHGDRVLFGNNNLYIVVFPGMEIDESLLDYEEAMREIYQEQLNQFKDEKYEKEKEEKLKKLREDMEREKAELEAKFKAEQDIIEQSRLELEERKKHDEERQLKIMEEARGNDEKARELEERLKQQAEEADRLRKQQELKEKEFKDKRLQALREMEENNRKREADKLHMLTLEGLQEQLAKMIIMCNEANEIAVSLGREKYHYEPFIDTVVLPNGSTIPKVFCKAYPDKTKEFHNVLSFDEMEDKMYLIRDKWEDYQYDIDHEGPSSKALEIGEDEGEIWGLMIRDDWHLIGNVFLFMDSLALLMGTPSDEAPIIDNKGKEQGKLAYSLDLKVLDGKDGKVKDTFLIDSLKECSGDEMEVSFSIHQAKNLPQKYCNEVFAEYQWIHDKAVPFATDKIRPKKGDNNPLFNYKRVHDLKIDNYIIENLADTTCIISVYGKLTEENMLGLYRDFSARPETANLLKTTTEFRSDAFYDAALNRTGKQDILKIDESNEQSEEDDEEKRKAKEEADRIKAELLKELEKYKKDNEELQKNIKTISKDKRTGCCTCDIF